MIAKINYRFDIYDVCKHIRQTHDQVYTYVRPYVYEVYRNVDTSERQNEQNYNVKIDKRTTLTRQQLKSIGAEFGSSFGSRSFRLCSSSS